ncbi:MAG TPA: hypothetical protein VFW02_07455, partial [Candidatus Limnocylindrales bacterium]|nr:hypothetical protein [Candidatus Limnocylindrales bacterium]
MSDEIVPQRCVIVLPSTGEFDSRTYRLARTLHERGHEVTVLARWKPGLARREVHEIGYPIIRVDATAVDGLPMRSVTLPILRVLRLGARPILGKPGARPTSASAGASGASAGAASSASSGAAGAPAGASSATPASPPDESEPGWAHPGRRPGTGYPSRVRDYVRRARIFLMIRSHRRQALVAAPSADLY